jgi:CubicO group peptidase (beta-lactamase class C family)
MKKSIALIFINLTTICLLAPGEIAPAYAQSRQSDDDYAKIDAYIEDQMEILNIPGLALAIVRGDRIVYTSGYGQAGPDDRAVTPQTPFILGSTGKSITALAVMQLVEAGQIDLDAPVQSYLSWFRTADPASSAQITVRYLLNQTSGFSNATGLEEFTANDLSDDAIESRVRQLRDAELANAPGSVHEYSNANYSVLGLIVQSVSGQSYEEYLQEHIFDPLEMRHSFTSQAAAERDGMVTGHVTWFRIPIAKDVPFNRGDLPGGYQICSVEDMAHFLIAQINGARYGDEILLSPEGIAAMHQAAVSTGSAGESYGMGWFVGPTNGRSSLHHEGDNANSGAAMVILPEERLGVMVMLNTNGTFVAGAHRQIASGVLAVLMGQEPQSYTSPAELTKVVGSVVVPTAASLLWAAWMLFRFLRRKKRGYPEKSGIQWILWVIVFPLLVDLGLLWVLLLGIPKLWGLPMDGLVLMFPDMATLIFGSVATLAGWGVARTTLTWMAAKPRSSTAGLAA